MGWDGMEESNPFGLRGKGALVHIINALMISSPDDPP